MVGVTSLPFISNGGLKGIRTSKMHSFFIRAKLIETASSPVKAARWYVGGRISISVLIMKLKAHSQLGQTSRSKEIRGNNSIRKKEITF